MTPYPNFVTIKRFSELTGYSEDAIRTKIKNGIWRMDEHYRKAPDGRILLDLRAYERWVEHERHKNTRAKHTA